MLRPFLLLLMLLPVILACKEEEKVREDTRSFLMGFSPWLYDATLEAQNWVYDTIFGQGDIISEHLEEGVPWSEALSGEAYALSFRNELQGRVNRIPAGKKVLLQISPLNVGRNGLADYRGNAVNEALPAPWDTISLKHPMVKQAFLSYARYMINYFNPDYVLLGVESNLLIRNSPSKWDAYVELQSYLYSELKKEYPAVPLSVSFFCVPFFPQWSPEDNRQAQLQGLTDLEPYVDYVAFSVHPFMSGLLAEDFPDDYLMKLLGLTMKPVAISESSYPAQEWSLISQPEVTFRGTQAKQKAFLKQLLETSARREALYLIWFTVRDYDALWHGMLGQSELALPWRDTGLFDEDGYPRSAWNLWKKWYSKEVGD